MPPFFPLLSVRRWQGLVHLPENLRREDYMSELLPDDDFFLMGRADGCVIDGRTADQLPGSPLAVAQMANHPPARRAANVLQAAYDYPSQESGGGGLGPASLPVSTRVGSHSFPPHLRPLIPNRCELTEISSRFFFLVRRMLPFLVVMPAPSEPPLRCFCFS